MEEIEFPGNDKSTISNHFQKGMLFRIKHI